MYQDKTGFIEQHLMRLFHLCHELLLIIEPSINTKLLFRAREITEKPRKEVCKEIKARVVLVLENLRVKMFQHELYSQVDDAASMKYIFYILHLLLTLDHDLIVEPLKYGFVQISPSGLYVNEESHPIHLVECKRQFRIAYFQQVLEVIKRQRFN